MELLIIDDDRNDRNIISEMLKDIFPGASCTTKESGNDAIKYLRQPVAVPDYIFIDIEMEVMDGKETLLKIKSMKTYSRTKIIMYSGEDNEQEQIVFRKLGANGYIKKTNSREALKKEIVNICNQSGAGLSV